MRARHLIDRPRRARHRLHVFAFAILALCFFAIPSLPARSAEDAPDLEQQIKAAYLYKFASYVEWPAASFPSPDTPLTIAVLGDDPLAADLGQAIVGHNVNGRSVAARRIAPGDSLAGVHILLIGPIRRAEFKELAQSAQQRSILTIAESADALDNGAVINFVLVDQHVRFEVSLPSAERSGLKLSARLLKVAAHVRTEER